MKQNFLLSLKDVCQLMFLSKMLIFHFNRYQAKNSINNNNNINNNKHILYLILIYQIYTTTILTCVNCENLIKTNIRSNSHDMSLIASVAASAGDEETDEQNSNLYSNSNSNSNISNNNNTNSNNNNIMCGNTQKMADNCFRDLPPHLMEFLQTSKIAINEQDIVSKCK